MTVSRAVKFLERSIEDLEEWGTLDDEQQEQQRCLLLSLLSPCITALSDITLHAARTRAAELISSSSIELGRAAVKRLETLVAKVLDERPGASDAELLTAVALLAIKGTSKRGRRPKWSGDEGVMLVIAIEATMEAYDCNNLDAAIAQIRESSARWRKDPEQTLRRAYYTALSSIAASKNRECGNS